MKAATVAKPRRETLNLRIPAAERTLIDRAAQSAGKTRTDFILEAARRAAEEALLDRAVTAVSPRAYAAFLTRLDAPGQPNERLRKTMQTPKPWARTDAHRAGAAGGALCTIFARRGNQTPRDPSIDDQ